MITQKTYVFLFGSSTFEDKSLTPIKNAEASLQHWEKFLLDENYFGMPSSQIQIHLNKNRDEVMSAFIRFCSQIPNDSLLIIYYAGHGVLDTEFSLYLSTPTSHVDTIKWTGISVNDLREQINQYKKISKVIILDCCFSAKFFKGILTTPEQLVETKIREMGQQKGLFVMASSGANVPSKFDSSNPNVPMNFTENILQAIQEGSEISDEFITAEQIFDRAKELCLEKQLPIPYKLITEDGARIVFVKNTKFSNANQLEADWLQTQNQNTIISYYIFIKKYPNNLYEFEALAKIADLEDELFWKQVQNQDTLKGYLNYIKKYPDGDFIDEAKKQIKNKTTNQTYQQPSKQITEQVSQKQDLIPQKPKIEIISKLPKAIQDLEKNMVYVEGGSYMMGSNDGQVREKPVHKVTLSDFYINKYQVTQAEWVAVMKNNPSHFKGCDNCPVEKVSWDDTQVFLKELNKMTGKQYRLLSEAEWEYAARGGKQSKGYQYAGSNSPDDVAWYHKNSGSKTHPVGQKQANELGLYDMSGNVWEWCQDWYDDNYYEKSNNLTNPINTVKADYKVMRGGSWNYKSAYCLVACRDRNDSAIRNYIIGFRICSPSIV
jgi:formylglycine-generating enzyme required for sulfatase activity